MCVESGRGRIDVLLFFGCAVAFVCSFDVMNADYDSDRPRYIDECIRWDVKYLLVWCYQVYCGAAAYFMVDLG